MKLKIISTLFILPLLFSGLRAQQWVCLNDSIRITLPVHRGETLWQISANGMDWTNLDGFSGDTITLTPRSDNFYRALITEGTCQPQGTDAIQILISMPPVLTFNLQDSVCINATAFILDSGNPQGGTYSGNGVIDGKFIPGLAGVGIHSIGYTYQDTLGLCIDSIFESILVLPLPDPAQAGNDILDIELDSVRLNALGVANGQGKWNILDGEGGMVSNLTDPKAWFKKDPAVFEYILEWVVESPCGTSRDSLLITFVNHDPFACPGTPTVTDADGNQYPTVLIGDQCWMAKSLNVGRYVRSTETNSPHSNASNNGIIEKYCFNNDPANCDLYGGLYDWNEAMGYTETPGVQGICPDGWHLPTDDDWEVLDDYYKYNDAGQYLKEGGGSGFEGQLAGDRHAHGMFVSYNSSGFYWSSSSYVYQNYNEGFYRELCACNPYLERGHFSKFTGASIRCIKDSE